MNVLAEGLALYKVMLFSFYTTPIPRRRPSLLIAMGMVKASRAVPLFCAWRWGRSRTFGQHHWRAWGKRVLIRTAVAFRSVVLPAPRSVPRAGADRRVSGRCVSLLHRQGACFSAGLPGKRMLPPDSSPLGLLRAFTAGVRWDFTDKRFVS